MPLPPCLIHGPTCAAPECARAFAAPAMIAVASSNLAALGWTPEPPALWADFRTGARYHYAGVPFDTFQAVLHAASVGSAFAAQVRAHPSRFPYVRID